MSHRDEGDVDSNASIDIEVEQDDPDLSSLSRRAPASLLGQVSLLDHTVDRLHKRVVNNNDWSDTREACVKFAGSPLVLTSVYTGAGGFEVGANWVYLAMQKAFLGSSSGHCPRITFYSACEVAPLPMQFITEHAPQIRPRHLQKDVLDRLFESNRARVTTILTISLVNYRGLKALRARGEIEQDDFMKQKRRLAASLVRNLDLEFRDFHFQERVECAICGQRCFVSPRSDPELSDMYWVECGGNTCGPWSMAGNRDGWLHLATLPAFTWAYSAKFFRPDTIIQENSPNFDEAVFIQIWCAEQLPDPPLSVFVLVGDDAADSESEAELELGSSDAHRRRKPVRERYSHESEIFNLLQLGLKISRARLYAAYHWEGRVVRLTLALEWEEFYFSSSCARPDIYFCADSETVAFEQRSRVSAMQQSVCDDEPGELDLVDVETLTLTNGDFDRLTGWDLKSKKHGLCEVANGMKIWQVAMAVANVGQRSEYWGNIPTMHLPALLPRCVFFDMVRRRQITVMELWVAQGYPHPDIAELQPIAHHFPCPHLVSRKSKRPFDLVAQRRLIGNGMHVCAVGLWFLHQVSSHELRR